MTTAALTPPVRAAVTPGECTADRDGAKCAREARLFAGGWRCPDDAPGAAPPLTPAQAA